METTLFCPYFTTRWNLACICEVHLELLLPQGLLRPLHPSEEMWSHGAEVQRPAKVNDYGVVWGGVAMV